MKRMNLVCLLVGGRGVGKTTYVKKIIAKESKKVLIVDTIDHPAYRDTPVMSLEKLHLWKKGIYRIFGSNTDEILNAISSTVTNALIVFEDSTKYIRYNVPDHVRSMIIDSKQKNLDMIFIYHSLGVVQPDMYRFCDIITLFKTQESVEKYSDKIANFPAVRNIFYTVKNSKNKYECKSAYLS